MQFKTKTIYNVAHGRPLPNSEKSVWNKVGVLIIDPDKERMSLHLDCIPAGDWNGWLSIFPPREEDSPKEGKKAPTSPTDSVDDFGDSVAF